MEKFFFKSMRINILYKFTKTPWGGGNQFLKALRNELIKKKKYSNHLKNANVVIINSHHFTLNFFFLYLIKKNLKIIHRIDGPITLTRSNFFNYIDYLIYLFSKKFADGVIFQSKWSKKKNIYLGFEKKIKHKVINNAPDNKIFFKRKNKRLRLKIIASSWSSNKNKGFEYLEYLDNNLSFKKIKITFVGNSPIKFKNIKIFKPLSSKKLSKLYKQYNFFLTASRNDPCSNSLIEAIHCGLIPIYLNSGGHSEISKNQGISFINKKDLLRKINQLNLKKKHDIKLKKINTIAEEYLNFIENINISRNNFFFRLYNILIFGIFFLFKKILK